MVCIIWQAIHWPLHLTLVQTNESQAISMAMFDASGRFVLQQIYTRSSHL